MNKTRTKEEAIQFIRQRGHKVLSKEKGYFIALVPETYRRYSVSFRNPLEEKQTLKV